MKKIFISILSICILFSVSGCSVIDNMTPSFVPAEKVFSIDDYNVQITADSSFQEATGGSFDLQITNGHSYISIMAYKYMDFAQNSSPQDIYDWHNEDLFSRRENVIVVEPAQTEISPEYTIVRTLYSAEKSNSKNYYASYLIDFPEKETFAWVLITATPSYFEKNSEYLCDIVTSMSTIP